MFLVYRPGLTAQHGDYPVDLQIQCFLYIGPFKGLNPGDSSSEQSVLYIGPETLHFLLAQASPGVVLADIAGVGDAILLQVSRMFSQPDLYVHIPAPVAVGVIFEPGFMGLALGLLATGSLAAGFLGFDGTDVRPVIHTAVRTMLKRRLIGYNCLHPYIF